jgi:phosphatidylinositol-3-phosphatase
MKLALALTSLALAGSIHCAHAGEGPTPRGVPHLDHVFVIMMENHGYSQIVNNPNAPFINGYARSANLATNYFAIAHPSLNNYLEVVGGSNFGVLSDNDPDWHNAGCATNLASGVPNTDNPPSPAICPVHGIGTDAAVVAIDTTNEASGAPGTINIDGVQSIPAMSGISGITIADQLARVGKTWKSYQENLPLEGPDRVNYSDGIFTNLSDFTKLAPALTPPLTSSNIVKQYAAKHNPFVYFRSVQEGVDANVSYRNIVAFDGEHGLYADLRDGHVPSYAFIAPNQCNDQHGRGNAGAFCNYDPNDNGTQAGLNPALIYAGDVTVRKLVQAIKSSKAWKDDDRRSAIVVLWDENDYSTVPNTNQVMLIVDTNYGQHGVVSAKRYNHYSLLKTIEGGLGLPCLNHACEAQVEVMSDLFAEGRR